MKRKEKLARIEVSLSGRGCYTGNGKEETKGIEVLPDENLIQSLVLLLQGLISSKLCRTWSTSKSV